MVKIASARDHFSSGHFSKDQHNNKKVSEDNRNHQVNVCIHALSTICTFTSSCFIVVFRRVELNMSQRNFQSLHTSVQWTECWQPERELHVGYSDAENTLLTHIHPVQRLVAAFQPVTHV